MSSGAPDAVAMPASTPPAAMLLGRMRDRVLENIGEALCVVDADWRIAYWNAAAERLSGVTRSRVLGRALWTIFPGLLGTPLERMLRSAHADRAPGECRNWRYPDPRRLASPAGDARDGGQVAARDGGAPAAPGQLPDAVYDARAYPADGGGVVVMFTDVSARAREERELAERMEETRALRELARAMSAVSDAAALLEILASAAQEHCGASTALVALLEPAAGEAEIVAAAGREAFLRGGRFPLEGTLFAAAARTRGLVRESSYVASNEYFRSFGDALDIGHVLLAPLVAQDEVLVADDSAPRDHVLGVLAVTRVVGAAAFTDQDAERLRVVADHAALALYKARLVEEAQTANAAKDSFLTTVSHELRTPLTALTGYGELLADEILGPMSPSQLEVVERMRSVTDQLTTMIDELLVFSALEAGRERVNLTTVGADLLVADVVEVAAPLAEQKSLVFTTRVPVPAPQLATDADKVRQILGNLAGNAVKFTDAGEVELAVDVDGATVRFAVRDSGPGIAEDDQLRLFQPFTQLDATLTRRHGGSGLGLYIAGRLARLLGGAIEVESVPGMGSTFTLVLARAAAAGGA